MTNATTTKSRTTLYVIIAIVVIVIIVGAVLAYQLSRPGGTPGGTTMDIYASDTPYGFGNSAGSVTSPGPTMTFTAGQTVTVVLHNVGTVPHNWAIVSEKTDGNTNLAFNGAQIASSSNPVPAGGTAQATFTVGSAGNYYYICQVDSHVSLGMWGPVVVNP